MGEPYLPNGMDKVTIRSATRTARTPDKRQIDAMEARACQFADALLAEGMKLDAPDKRLMVKILTLRAASKVIARLAREEKLLPTVAVDTNARHFAEALRLAIQAELVAEQRLAMAMSQENAK